MKTPSPFTAHLLCDGKWFVAFSLEFPKANGQALTEEAALESLRESILLSWKIGGKMPEQTWATGKSSFPLPCREAQGLDPPPRSPRSPFET